jgi:type VI protein secretion system component VasK
LKESAAGKFSDEFVAYLNNAFNLRKVLFGTSPTPKFEFEYTLKPVTGSMVEVVIDGKKATSEGTGSLKTAFPGSGSELGVLANLVSTAGTTATTTPEATQPTTGPQPLRFPGAWGIFRFVDAGGAKKQATGEYQLTHTVSGKTVTSTIKPSGGDLFDKTIFRQVKAPDSFLKK